ncbi:MAG: MFS transporter [Bacteroidota bacterium]
MRYFHLLLKYPRYIGYGMLHYFFSGPGQSFFLALFSVYFGAAVLVDEVEFASLYSAGTLMSALLIPWVGKLLDEVMLRKFSLVLGLVFSAFCVLASFVFHPIMLIFVFFGLRLCGQGLMPLTASTAIARYFEAERGQALALVNMGVSLAEMSMPAAIVFMIGWAGWQQSWWIVAAVILLIFLPLSWFLIPANSSFQFNQERTDTKKNDEKSRNQSASRAEVLRDPSFYILTLVYLFVPFFVTGIFVNQALLGKANGWSLEQLAAAFALFGTSRFLTNLLAGPIIDRITALRAFSGILIPMAIGTSLLLFSNDIWVGYAFFMFSGVSASLSSLTSTAMWAEMYGTGSLGAIRSMVSTFMVFSTAAAPIIMGWILADGADSVYAMMLGAVIVMAFFTLLAFWRVGMALKGRDAVMPS